jgi:Outer membrane lipoprotein-sorting protein
LASLDSRRSALRALALVLACVVGVFAGAPQHPEPGAETAEWIARQVDQRDTGKDSRFDMTMTLFDRQGRTRERRLTVMTLRAAGARGDRVLVRFEAPNDIKGTGLLVWEHPTAEDERFLYLPALGRVRRIAGAEKQESFVGSDFSYEDIGGREFDDYEYALIERNATLTGSSGEAVPAWRLESKSRDTHAAYPRVVSLVRKDNFVVVSAEIFNRRNEREKRYDVRDLRQVDGIWTAMALTMTNDLQRTRTDLAVTSARYNVGLGEGAFTRRELEQRSR